MAARTIDECIDEIFRTTKNRGNKTAWRLKKMRFYRGELPDHGKKALLEEFGYVLVSEATYVKVQPPPSQKQDKVDELPD